MLTYKRLVGGVLKEYAGEESALTLFSFFIKLSIYKFSIIT